MVVNLQIYIHTVHVLSLKNLKSDRKLSFAKLMHLEATILQSIYSDRNRFNIFWSHDISIYGQD